MPHSLTIETALREQASDPVKAAMAVCLPLEGNTSLAEEACFDDGLSTEPSLACLKLNLQESGLIP